MNRTVWYFNVMVGNRLIADGVVIADTIEEAERKVKKEYTNPYEKVEITTDDNGTDGTKENKNVEGLFVRWEN